MDHFDENGRMATKRQTLVISICNAYKGFALRYLTVPISMPTICRGSDVAKEKYVCSLLHLLNEQLALCGKSLTLEPHDRES